MQDENGKAIVKEEEVVKHWGLKENGRWLVDNDSIIVHFTCPRVANVQKDILDSLYEEMGDDGVITVEEIK